MKNKIFILIAILLTFLASCGKAGDSEHTVSVSNSTVVEEPATLVETKTADVTEPNTLRLNGDYDSVPTVIQPKPLSEKELKSISIPTSPNDPYSYVISDLVEWYKQAGPDFISEFERYSLYDINGDGTDELILGDIGVLGGTSVHEEHEGVTAEFTYGLLINSVYTIQNGKAVEAKRLIISENAYQTMLLDNGMIKILYQTPRNPQITYYKMTGDNFEMVGGNLDKNFDGECYYYEKDKEEKISEEEFNRRISEIEDGAHPVELEWKHLQDYGK